MKKDEGNGVVATSKYCAKAIEDDEDDEEVNKDEEDEEEENRVAETQGNGDDVDVFEALFKPLSSLPTSSQAAAPTRHRYPQSVNKLFIGLHTPSHVTLRLVGQVCTS